MLDWSRWIDRVRSRERSRKTCCVTGTNEGVGEWTRPTKCACVCTRMCLHLKVGVANWATCIREFLLNKFVQNRYSWKFKPVKYKRYTVFKQCVSNVRYHSLITGLIHHSHLSVTDHSISSPLSSLYINVKIQTTFNYQNLSFSLTGRHWRNYTVIDFVVCECNNVPILQKHKKSIELRHGYILQRVYTTEHFWNGSQRSILDGLGMVLHPVCNVYGKQA